MSPHDTMLPHLLVCDAMYSVIHTRFPRLPWLFEISTVRILCFFAVGALEALVLLDGRFVDAVWAALVVSESRGMTGPGPFLARLDALARLSPRASAVLAMYS